MAKKPSAKPPHTLSTLQPLLDLEFGKNDATNFIISERPHVSKVKYEVISCYVNGVQSIAWSAARFMGWLPRRLWILLFRQRVPITEVSNKIDLHHFPLGLRKGLSMQASRQSLQKHHQSAASEIQIIAS